tara:strand:+ start:368 stop:607 length:240 start_codon:yes stop_codon:yes gene_type:complete
MNKNIINFINKYNNNNNNIPNNFSVQIYDKKTDNKLDVIYLNNSINLDFDDENFNERFEKELLNNELTYNMNDIYYSIL